MELVPDLTAMAQVGGTVVFAWMVYAEVKLIRATLSALAATLARLEERTRWPRAGTPPPYEGEGG